MVEKEKRAEREIISDMTRQYKSVEEDLMDHINRLNKRKLDNQEQLKALDDKKKE